VTRIYRGKVSRQVPWTQHDGHWQPLDNQPYPVVSLADADPAFDHTGMPVLVVADPDQGDHTELLDRADHDLHMLKVGGYGYTSDLVADLLAVLRATLAQRDEARARVADLEFVVEAVRQWGPHTPRRVTRALAVLDGVAPSTAPDPTENPDA
jgi:hypothetical protein